MQTSLSSKFSFVLASALIAVGLAACGREHAAKSTEATSSTVLVAQMTKIMGDFSVSQTASQITVDQLAVNEMKIGTTALGKIEFSGSATIEKKNYDFDLKGEIGADGMAILRPDDTSSPLRARVFCLDSDDRSAHPCDQYFVDIYFKQVAGTYLHVQLVRHADFNTSPSPSPSPTATPEPVALPAVPPVTPPKPSLDLPTAPVKPATPVKPTTPVVPPKLNIPAIPPVSPKPSTPKRVTPVPQRGGDDDTGVAAKAEEEEADDAPAPDGAFVGLQDKDKIDELFNPAATTDAGTLAPDMTGERDGRPVDQSVGTYARGHLERASSLGPDSPTYFIPAANLKRYYGAYVTIRFIEKFATTVMARLPGFKLRVDDISGKTGGPLCLSSGAKNRNGTCVVAHKSHEIGLDADIGYLMDIPYTSVPQAVSRGRMSAHVRKPLQWDMFKAIHQSNLVSTVFVDAAVKRGFCAYAKSLGQATSEAGTLTMLRPLESHQSHFHLRFMCTKFNPRCQNDKTAGRSVGC